MNSKGHMGLSLLIMSLILFLFSFKDINALYLLIFTTAFSSFPDIDLRLELEHRKYTHNILFAVVIGVIFAIIFNYAGMLFLGFISAFVGTVSHLIGDVLTYQKFNPLWPFGDVQIGLGLFYSNDSNVNNAFMTLGFLAFMAYLSRYAGIL